TSGARAGNRCHSVGDEYRVVLRRLVAGSLELHHDDVEHAGQGSVADAAAAYLLGVVYDGGACIAFVSGVACRRDSAPAGSSGGDELLHTGQRICQWEAGDGSQRRLTDPLAAPVLVLRAPGGLYRDSARHGVDLALVVDLLTQAGLRLSSDGVCAL